MESGQNNRKTAFSTLEIPPVLWYDRTLERRCKAMPFFVSFLQYAGILILLAAIAVGGIFFGRFLRMKKDAREASQNTNE